jgi:hypothetical protein
MQNSGAKRLIIATKGRIPQRLLAFQYYFINRYKHVQSKIPAFNSNIYFSIVLVEHRSISMLEWMFEILLQSNLLDLRLRNCESEMRLNLYKKTKQKQLDLNICGFHIVVLVLLYDKGVSIPPNTTMFDFISAFFTPATCFGLLSGHHQALGYTIPLYTYLLLLLTAIHY